jgi:hypothetical protein
MDQNISLSEESLSRSRFITVLTAARHRHVGFNTEQMNYVHTKTSMTLP